MHPALARQLRRLGLDPSHPPDVASWSQLLDAVGESYRDADKTRYRMERALNLSSEEGRDHIARQTALARCAEALLVADTGSPEADALEAICGAVGVDAAWVIRVEDGPHLVASYGPIDTSRVLELARRRANRTPSLHSTIMGGPGEHDLCAPIYVRNVWKGMLGFRTGDARARWGDVDVELITTAAAMVAAHWAREETQDRLEELVLSKDRFVASVSHELRTPLTGVVGFARELQAQWHAFSQDEVRDIIDVIVQQSEDVANMVEDLLVVARADIGRVRLHPEPVDLRHQVKVACGRSMPDFADRVSFEGNGVAMADPVRVRQIVRNLVTNALRYGGSRIRVRIVRDLNDVRLEVRDNGAGVPDDAVERIFSAFESAHDTPTQPNAIGLGLWVAKTLAELMGGELSHRREHGETVFTLALPTSDLPVRLSA